MNWGIQSMENETLVARGYWIKTPTDRNIYTDQSSFGYVDITLLESPQFPGILSAFSPEQIHENVLNKTKVISADLLDFTFDLDFYLRTFLDLVTFQFW